MSTKINVRSPYFLEFVEPTPTLGTFDCSTANLRNFLVSSAGVITEPALSYGSIIERSATSFPENTSGSDIQRTVTYTIAIPPNYTNSSAGTITCDAIANQPSQTAQEDPVQNDNCPIFSGTIPNVTDSTSTTIDLATYFTAGSGATISRYSIIQTGNLSITNSVNGNNLTIQSDINCLSATFRVIARNSADACTAASNTFTFSTPCTEDFDCDDVNLQSGKIYQNGDHSLSSFAAGLRLKELLYNGSVISSPFNVGDNTSGSPVDKTITYRFYIPQGYNNYSVGATIDCDKTYSQPSADILPVFDCAEANIKGIVISERGNIGAPTSYNGTLVGWTPQSFDEVTFDTARTVSVEITPPSTLYNNSGGSNIICDVPVVQPGIGEGCGSFTIYLTPQAPDYLDWFCGIYNYTILAAKITGVSNFNDVSLAYGERICVNDSFFNGGNKYYAYAETSGRVVGIDGIAFKYIQIDESGVIQDVGEWRCDAYGY